MRCTNYKASHDVIVYILCLISYVVGWNILLSIFLSKTITIMVRVYLHVRLCS
jgi:hypothetical protein